MEELYRDLERVGYPCVLVSRIPGDTGNTRSTRAARIDGWDEAEAWVRAATEAGRNLYIVRNPVLDGRLYRRNRAGERVDGGRWGNPPLLEDIAAVRWLPIDLDPVDNNRLDDATRARVLDTLGLLDRECPLKFVMDSGRGIQAQVELGLQPTRSDTEGWKAALELALRIEKWLGDRLKGVVTVDSISNVNRFTRLVGTVNQKTGCTTKFISWSPHCITVRPELILPDYEMRPKRIYVPAERVADGLSTNRHIQDVLRELGQYDPNSVVRELLAELEQGPSDEALSPVFQWWAEMGEDPVGLVDPNRSNRQHHFAHAGIRAGEPVRALYAALVNPDHRILNAHVIEKRKSPEREAVRNLAKAIIMQYFDAEFDYA